MAQHTKNAIRDGFLELLDEKSFDKISVVDIAQKSQVNRNTFYYYYPDVFALVDDLLRHSTKELIEKAPQGTSWYETLLQVTSFARSHQQAIYHLFQSQNRDRIERYLYDVVLIGTEALVRAKSKALNVCEHDLHVLAVYYASSLLGLIMNWFLNGMKENAEVYLADISRLLEGSTHHLLLEKAGKNPPL